MMLIRSLLLSAFFLLLAVAVKSQDYKYLYHLDLNLATVPKADAVILGKGLKENNLFRLDCFSALSNVLLMTVHFKDSSLTEIEGPFRSYYFSGKPEKEGNYVKGFEDGVWINWDTLARKSDSTFYKNGTPMIIAKYRYQNKGGLEYYTLFDSLKNTYRTISYNENGGVDNEVFFKGQNGIMKTYTRSGIKIDSLNTREETEPLFPGGEAGWLYYLKKNLNPFVPVVKQAPAGKYTVIVKFRITEEGGVEDIVAETNHGYGMENEVIRIINSGPSWIPAIQYGRPVSSYRRQPVTFLKEDDK